MTWWKTFLNQFHVNLHLIGYQKIVTTIQQYTKCKRYTVCCCDCRLDTTSLYSHKCIDAQKSTYYVTPDVRVSQHALLEHGV